MCLELSQEMACILLLKKSLISTLGYSYASQPEDYLF